MSGRAERTTVEGIGVTRAAETSAESRPKQQMQYDLWVAERNAGKLDVARLRVAGVSPDQLSSTRLPPMGTTMRLDVEQRRAVHAVETAHRDHAVLDADQLHQRGADGVGPVG